MPTSYTAGEGVKKASWRGESSRRTVVGVYRIVTKNKLNEKPKLPKELRSTKDAIVEVERLRLRPKLSVR